MTPLPHLRSGAVLLAGLAMTLSMVTVSVTGTLAGATASPTWTAAAPLPTGSAATGAETFSDPAGGEMLFWVLNGVPTVAVVAASGVVGAPGPVPTVQGQSTVGTTGKVAFLGDGGAVITWTITATGAVYMAYRSAAGVWGTPLLLPLGLSNLAVRTGEVLVSEDSGTGISVESWTLSGTGALSLASGPTNVYTGGPLFGQSWLALDASGSAELVVYGSIDDFTTESLTSVSRSTAGVWGAQSQISATGSYVNDAAFATAPGGRSVLAWVTGNTNTAALSFDAVRPVGGPFGAANSTGSVSAVNGAFIVVTAAAGSDGTLAASFTQRVYSTSTAFSLTTAVSVDPPGGAGLGAGVGISADGLPLVLGAGDGEAILGTVVTTETPNAAYPDAYNDTQQVTVTVVTTGSSTIAQVLGSSSGLYDGNGGDGCPCPTGPPTASLTGVALDAHGNGVAVGQLAPGQSLESASYVVPLDIAAGGFAPLTPTRILDTRIGTGGTTGPVAAGATVHLQVDGVGGVPATGVAAVALNVTVTGPTARGYLTVWPDQVTQPTTSSLNFSAGETVPNLVIAPVGSNGKVDFYNGSGGTVQIIGDVSGYFTSGPPAGGGFAPVTPTRVLDTRIGTGGTTGPVASGATVHLQVEGAGGVPATGVAAVAFNVTVTGPSAGGYLTVWPDNVTRPTTSSLNFIAGETVPNLVVAPVGRNGKVDFYNGSSGTVQIIGDVSGYFTSGTPAAGGFAPVTPTRILDTRNTTGGTPGPVVAGATVKLQVEGVGGVPATGVAAVALNVTVTGPSARGYLTVWPDQVAQPTTSSLNFSAGETVPNLVIAPVGSNGKVDFYNGSGGTVQIIGDVSGYFTSG